MTPSLESTPGLSESKEISIYADDNLTPEGLAESIKRVKISFPSLSEDFHEIFAIRIKEKGIGDNRLRDAVNHVIDNCVYPVPTVANFLSFDRKVRLYDYAEILQLNDDKGAYPRTAFKYFSRLESGVYAKNTDIKTYGLK